MAACMDTKSTIQSIVTDLLDKNVCKSLQILPEKSGSTLVKIRLVGDISAGNQVNHVNFRSNFKLKNDNQVKRDFGRSKKYHSEPKIDNDKPSRNRKKPSRYTDDRNLEIENPRSENLEQQSHSQSILTSPGSVTNEPCMADDSLLDVCSVTESPVKNECLNTGLNESVSTDVNSHGFHATSLDSSDTTATSGALVSIKEAISKWPESLRNNKTFMDHCFTTLNWSLDSRRCYYCDRRLVDVINRTNPPPHIVEYGKYSDDRDGRMAYCDLCNSFFCEACVNYDNYAEKTDGCECSLSTLKTMFITERIT